MKRIVLIAVLVVVAGGVRAMAAGDAAAGKTVFDTKCKMCHGPDGEGNPAIAKALNTTIPPFSSKEVQSLTDDQIKKRILQGGTKMKPVSGMDDTSIANVIAFIRTLKK